MQRLASIPLLALALWLLIDYPLWQGPLAALIVALGFAQLRHPGAWLLTLPSLAVVLNLAPWSGRLLLDEFDAACAVLLAAALATRQIRPGTFPAMARPLWWPWWLFLVTSLIAIARPLWPPVALDPNAWSGYLSQWNALRVGRGTLWAAAFTPLLVARVTAPGRPGLRELRLGWLAGALVLGVAVLWERGFFQDLATAGSVWDLYDSWLNFASRYRLTGPFAQMHFGGSAIDGYLVLAWPFAVFTLLGARRPAAAGVAALASALMGYAILVTFTRMTYLAVGASALVTLGLFLARAEAGFRRLALAAVALTGTLALAGQAGFQRGGILVPAAAGLALVGAVGVRVATTLLAPRAGLRAGAWPAAGSAIVAALALIVALYGLLSSKYHDNALMNALAIAVPMVALAAGGGHLLARFAVPRTGPTAAVSCALVAAMVLPAFSLALGGTQITTRFSQVSADLDSRLDHWRNVLAIAGERPLTGHGAGSYPRLYLETQGPASEGAYVFSGSGLRLAGSGLLGIGQRLPEWRPGPYLLRARIRTLEAGRPFSLGARIARRPLLAQEWFGSKVDVRLRIDADAMVWQELEVLIDTSRLASPRWYQPRFSVFSISAPGKRVIEIDYLELFDAQGHALLRNGDFLEGGDHWLAFNDFEHLALHAKGLWLFLLVEQGAAGLGTFALMMATALGAVLRRRAPGDSEGLAICAAVTGFLLVGITATLFDVPSLTLLFGLLVAAALATTGPTPGAGATSGPGRHQP